VTKPPSGQAPRAADPQPAGGAVHPADGGQHEQRRSQGKTAPGSLKQVQQVMEAEEGKPIVEDLLFNNLIVQ
jgi:hypothetical protein